MCRGIVCTSTSRGKLGVGTISSSVLPAELAGLSGTLVAREVRRTAGRGAVQRSPMLRCAGKLLPLVSGRRRTGNTSMSGCGPRGNPCLPGLALGL